jgi:hypothetical protein
MNPSSDAELMVESLADVGRFGEIFDRHAPAIFRLLGRRIGPDSQSLADIKKNFDEVAELTKQFI